MRNKLLKIFPVFALALMTYANCQGQSTDESTNVVNDIFSEKISYDNGIDETQQEDTSWISTLNNNAGKEYAYSNFSSGDQHVSDTKLMKEYIIKDANRIKKQGVIGGSILGGLGVATILTVFIVSSNNDNLADYSIQENTLIGTGIGVPLIIGGFVWMGVARRKANKMINEVKYISMLEHDVFSKGNNSLSASLDFVNSDSYVKAKGIGVSLRYNF